jgi:hypothetical protein
MMRIVITLIATILALPAWAEPQESPKFIGGAGATRCDEWLEARQQKASILSFGLEDWVLGFVSGVNLMESERHDLLLNVSEKDVFARVDFYCREHASDILFQAAAIATADLLRTRATAILKQSKER